MDKIVLVKKGMSTVRFKVMDTRDHVLNGHYFFDMKPLTMKSLIWILTKMLLKLYLFWYN